MLYPNQLKRFYAKVEKLFKANELIAGKSGRHMKFPYTISAKIAQFPFFYYMQHNNVWMYYPFGIGLGFYVFLLINNVMNSDENKRSWAETQRKSAEKEHSH